MKYSNQFLRAGFVLLAAVVLVSCSSADSSNPQMGGMQPPQPYPVLTLQPRSITLTSSYPATLEGVQTIEIRPRVPGFITAIPVDEGDLVEKGEVLFQLNREEYEQQVQAAEAEVMRAKNQIKRLTPLAEQGIISEFELEEAKINLQSAQAALINAQVNLGYTTIRSPVNGVMGTIPYRVGSLVNSTIARPLTTVSDISKMYAYFSMSERELLEMALNVAGEGGNKTLSQLVAGMPQVSFEMANNRIYVHKGTLKLASGIISTRTGSAQFRAEFPNPQQILRSGATGNVIVPVPLDSVIVIPKSATYEIQENRFVYTVTDSNTVRSTLIETQPLSTNKLFVVSEGLSSGSVIVTTGMGRLRPDAKIKPQPVNADSLYKTLK